MHIGSKPKQPAAEAETEDVPLCQQAVRLLEMAQQRLPPQIAHLLQSLYRVNPRIPMTPQREKVFEPAAAGFPKEKGHIITKVDEHR